MGGPFENQYGNGGQQPSGADYLSNVRAQMLTGDSPPPNPNTTSPLANGQWHAPYGGDVPNNFRPGQPTQVQQPGRAPYGGDVPQTYNPGAQPGNPPGYDGTIQAGMPQPAATSPADSRLLPGAANLPGSGDMLPGASNPSPERNMFANAIAGGTGAWLMGGPIPDFLSRNSAKVLESSPPLQLGTKYFAENGWVAKNINSSVATALRTNLDTAPTAAANWWKSIEVPRVKPTPAVDATAAPAATAAADATAAPAAAAAADATAAPAAAAAADATATAAPGAAAAVDAGKVTAEAAAASKTFKIAGTTIDLTKTGEFLAKPGVQDFLKGAGIAGGTVLADHLTPGNDSYGFSTLGVPIALAMPGDFKTKALVAGGSLAAGKIFNALVPAGDHPELHNFLAPTLTENAVMTGALFLPTNAEAKLYTIGATYGLGRMAKMNDLAAGGTAVAIGAGAWAYTHNATVGVLAGAGSYLGSRFFKYL